jgi:hypothetical protein
LINASGTAIGAATATATGTYTVSPSSPLVDGAYALRVIATDAAGNLSAASNAFNLTILTATPVAPSAPSLATADDSGTKGDGITNVKQPHLNGTALAGLNVQLVIASGAVIGSANAAPDGSYSIIPATPLADGSYAVQARETDVAGNLSALSAPFSLTIRATPPATPSNPALLPADDSGVKGDGITNVKQPHFTGTAPVGTTVQLINSAGTVLGSATVTASGSYTVAPASPLADGVSSLHTQDIDVAGNLSASSGTLGLTIDTTAPAAPAAPTLLPADDTGTLGDGITGVNPPRVVGNAEPGSTVLLVDGSGHTLGTTTAASDGTYTVQPQAALAIGTTTVAVRAVDAAGNASVQSPPFNLTIVAAALPTPGAPALSPTDDTGVVGDGRTSVRLPHLIGTTQPGLAVELLDASGQVLSSTTAAPLTGAYTIQPPASLSTGTFALRVRVRNASGALSPAGAPFNLTIVDATANDFEGDGKSDLGVFRPSTMQWLVAYSNGTGSLVQSFGGANLTDIPVPGDYDGTGHTELAVFRPSTAQWIILSPSGPRIITFGAPNLIDIPVPGDYDGTGHTELAVFRPSTSQWFVVGPTGGRLLGTFGAPNLTDIPIPGDYDGLGHTEMGLYRPSTSQWFVLGPNGGRLLGTFGAPNLTDIPVPGDYDGVGHTELAVYRPSTSQWFVLGPGGGRLLGTFGAPNLKDIPVPGNWDGTGRTEPAVYRPSTSQWFALGASGGRLVATFGAPNLIDIPVPGTYDTGGRTQPAVFRPSTSQWFALEPSNGVLLTTFGGSNYSDIPMEAPIGSLVRLGLTGNGGRPRAVRAVSVTGRETTANPGASATAAAEVLAPWVAPTDTNQDPSGALGAPRARQKNARTATVAWLEALDRLDDDGFGVRAPG